MDVRHGALDAGELLVVVPAFVGVRLRQLRELGGAFGMGPLEDGEAGLGGHEVGDRDRWRARVELEGLAALDLGRMEAIQRPVAALDRILLVGHRLAHVDPVGDAGAVGDDQRRTRPGIGLEQRLGRLEVVRAHRDLGDVDVAVRTRDRAEVLLGGPLAGGRELRHGAARRRLRGLATGVRVDLGVEDEDVDVPTGREDLVDTSEADVVGPAVAADDPDALAHQIAGERQQMSSVGAERTVDPGERLAEAVHPLALEHDLGFRVLRGPQDARRRAPWPSSGARRSSSRRA